MNPPLISCICPTYNRAPNNLWMLEEAIESFLRQDYPNKELIVLNDSPGQELTINKILTGFNVRIINHPTRFRTLGLKIGYAIAQAKGELLCRFDDDDIQLPHRLSYTFDKLGDSLEWRANNHWYTPRNEIEGESHNGGNSHTRALFRREVLDKIGGYPRECSGWEDQEFNRLLLAHGINSDGHNIPTEEIYSLYRWGISRHLSAAPPKDPDTRRNLQKHYDFLGTLPAPQGEFELRPNWRKDYTQEHRQACAKGELVNG